MIILAVTPGQYLEYMTELQKILFSLVEKNGIVYFLLDTNHNIEMCSDNMFQVFGYDPPSILGMKLDKLCFGKDRDRLSKLLESALVSKDEKEIEFRLLLSDRRIRIVSATVQTLVTDDNNPKIAIFLRDITDHLNSKLFKDSFFNLSLDLFAILDFTGKVIEINEMWNEKFGYTKEELIKSGIAKVFKSDERMAAGRMYDWLKVSNESMYDYEMECCTKTGETKFISWSARSDALPGLVFLVGRDFTEKKETEQKLVESESKLSAILENTNDVIFSIDINYKLLKFNTAFVRIIEGSYGFKPKAGYSVIDPKVNTLTTMKWKRLYDLALSDRDVDELIDADPPNENLKYEVSMSPIKNEFKDVTGVAVFLRDVTERFKAQEAQLEMSRQLAEKNKDLLDFSFIITHNLRAPTSNLISLLSLYDKDHPANDENLEIMENFEASIHQLNETLADLTMAVKLREEVGKKFELLNLDEVFNNVKSKLPALESKGTIVLKTDFSTVPELIYPKGDLESIFYTLLDNSIKFAHPGRECVISVTSFIVENRVHLTFEDNGMGIDLERYGDRLFGLYQRFHRSDSGKGLGLYFLNTAIKSFGGSISVESEPGKGSKFTVKLIKRESE
jgi:PAS domain S-box-containing protein